MTDWLDTSRRALEEASATEVPALSQNEIDELLDLARVAAHDSGDRINAPLVCYLLGLAQARGGERSLSELVEAVIRANDAAGA